MDKNVYIYAQTVRGMVVACGSRFDGGRGLNNVYIQAQTVRGMVVACGSGFDG